MDGARLDQRTLSYLSLAVVIVMPHPFDLTLVLRYLSVGSERAASAPIFLPMADLTGEGAFNKMSGSARAQQLP